MKEIGVIISLAAVNYCFARGLWKNSRGDAWRGEGIVGGVLCTLLGLLLFLVDDVFIGGHITKTIKSVEYFNIVVGIIVGVLVLGLVALTIIFAVENIRRNKVLNNMPKFGDDCDDYKMYDWIEELWEELERKKIKNAVGRGDMNDVEGNRSD